MLESQAVSDIDGVINQYKDPDGVTHTLGTPRIIGNDENADPDDDYITYGTKSGAYYYNGDGMRIKKDVVLTDGDDDHTDDATTLRKYYYTGSAVLFVADSSNNKLLENILMPNGTTLMSARYEQEEEGNPINGYYTFNTDIRGSITNILNNSGTLTTGYVYDEYGNQIKTGDEDFLNEATYTGAIYDDESELYYMNARYYSASTGQFTTRDTYLGNAYNPATHNLYTYTGNNPINFIDPTGHRPMTVENTYGQYSYWDPMDCFANPEPIAIVPSSNVKVKQGLEINKKVNSANTISTPFFNIKSGVYSLIGSIGNNISKNQEYISIDSSFGILSESHNTYKNSAKLGITSNVETIFGTMTNTTEYDYLNDEWSLTNAVCSSNYFCANSYAVGKKGRYFSFTHFSGISIQNGFEGKTAPYLQIDTKNENIAPVLIYSIPFALGAAAAETAGGAAFVMNVLRKAFAY